MADPIIVNSVSDFLARVTEEPKSAKDRLHSNVSSVTLFRGQADSAWSLSPSLYRQELFKHERALITELRRVRPDEFKGLTDFDVLVKMQHYGLPTRLLDMTHNPLVALYFACEDINERPGSVYALRSLPVFWQDNYAVRLIMRYVFDFSGSKLDLANFVRAVSNDPIVSQALNEQSDLNAIALHYLTKVPAMAVRPSLENRRLSRQDGAFLLFGMSLKKHEISNNIGTKGRSYLHLSPYRAEGSIEDLWHEITEYQIPADKKQEILYALERLGIARSKLFPELQYQAEFVKNTISGDLTQC